MCVFGGVDKGLQKRAKGGLWCHLGFTALLATLPGTPAACARTPAVSWDPSLTRKNWHIFTTHTTTHPNVPKVTRLYFLVGGGFFRMAIDDVTVSSSQESVTISGAQESAVGVNLGTRIVLGRVYGEVSYLLGFTDVQSTALLSFRAGFAFESEIGK